MRTIPHLYIYCYFLADIEQILILFLILVPWWPLGTFTSPYLWFLQLEFCSLTHLIRVDLSKNQLTSLPDDLGNLSNLQHLDLYNNKLTSLPVSFSQLRVSTALSCASWSFCICRAVVNLSAVTFNSRVDFASFTWGHIPVVLWNFIPWQHKSWEDSNAYRTKLNFTANKLPPIVTRLVRTETSHSFASLPSFGHDTHDCAIWSSK